MVATNGLEPAGSIQAGFVFHGIAARRRADERTPDGQTDMLPASGIRSAAPRIPRIRRIAIPTTSDARTANANQARVSRIARGIKARMAALMAEIEAQSGHG